MESIAIVLSLVTFFIVAMMQNKVRNLEDQVKKLTQKLQTNSDNKSPKTDLKVKSEDNSVQDLKYNKVIEPENPIEIIKDPIVVKKESKFEIVGEKFLKNWTGVIGTITLVMGFGFLGVFVAINMNPFSRFLVFVAAFVLFILISLHIEKKLNLIKTALWLRSGAGAIFLFSCVGSAGIPGLMWVDNYIAGLLLLLVGIIVNLSLGYVSGRQIVSSIHVFLSLLAISIAPPTTSTFLVATVVTMYGIYLTYKKNWDVNLIIIISLYFAFHLYWFKLLRPEDITTVLQVTALLSIVTIFFMSLFIHYRHIYSVSKFQLIPFLTHFLNWVFLATGLYLYSGVIPAKILLLALGSLAALFIAKRAKTLSIRWLFITDTLVANLLMILAILSFYPRGVNPFFISLILFVESMIFTVVVTWENEEILTKIAYLLNCTIGLVFVVAGFSLEDYDSSTLINFICLTGVFILLFSLYTLAINKNTTFTQIDVKFKSILSILLPIIIFVMYVNMFDYNLGSYVLLFLIPVYILKNKTNFRLMDIGLKVVIVLSLLIAWTNIDRYSVIEKTVYFLPILALSFYMARTAFGVYILNSNIIYFTYILFNEKSEYIVGIIWLFLSFINLEFSNKIKKIAKPLKHSGLLLLAMYFVRHFMVHIGADYYILMDILSFVGLVYWLVRSKNLLDENNKVYGFISRHILEIIYIFVITTVLLEVELTWQPVVWVVIALTTLFYQNNTKDISRIRFYSLFLTWMSSFHLAFIYSLTETSWVTGVIVIAINTIYLLNFKRLANFKNITIPENYSLLIKIRDNIVNNQYKFVYFPFFIAVAFFILFNFNDNIITLLFVLLSLIIFILSIRLQESSFRIISLLGIAGCLIRMLFFDLTNSGTIIRSLVFIGMGVVMLFMNVIFNKFRENHENKDQ